MSISLNFRKSSAVAAVAALLASLVGLTAPASAATMTYSVTTFPLSPTDGGPSCIAQSGTKIFACQNGLAGQLWVFDTTTQAYVWSTPMAWGHEVEVSNGYLFAASSSGIKVYDISTMTLVKAMGGDVAALRIFGTTMYVGYNDVNDTTTAFDMSDPTTPRLLATAGGLAQPNDFALVGSDLWVPNYSNGMISILDAGTLALKTIVIQGSDRPAAAINDATRVYVADPYGGYVYGFTASSRALAWSANLGRGVYDMYQDSHGLWAANSYTDTIYQLDPATGATIASFTTGEQPYSVTGDGTDVWTGNNRGASFTRLHPTPKPTAAKSTIAVDKASLVDNGTSQSTVTVTVNDSDGNPIADSDVCITLDSGTGTLSSGPWKTDANGQVTATLTSDTVAGSGTVKATFGTCASPGDSIGTKTVNYVAPPDATKSSIARSLDSVPASGTAYSVITATVRDADNAVMADMDVCFTVDSGKGTLASGPWHTDANGNATVNFSSVNAGTGTVKATLGTCDAPGATIGTTSVNFTSFSVAEKSTVTVDKTSIDADGKAKAKITVTVNDQEGNAFAGQPVCISLTDGTGTVTVIGSGTSDANGHVTADLLSPTSVGFGKITATFDGEGCGYATIGDVTVNYTHYAGTNTTLSVSENTVPGDGKSSTDVEFTLIDETGAPIVGQDVCLVASAGTLSAGPWTTDANGKVTAKLTAPSFARKATVTAHRGACGTGGPAYALARVTFTQVDDSQISQTTMPGGKSGGGLPRTGSDPWMPLLAAALLLAAGLGARRWSFATRN